MPCCRVFYYRNGGVDVIQAITPEIDRGLTIILDDLDFTWRDWQLDEAVHLWGLGIPYEAIVERVRPPVSGQDRQQSYSRRADEVVLLLMHLARQDRIMPREKGVLR